MYQIHETETLNQYRYNEIKKKKLQIYIRTSTRRT